MNKIRYTILLSFLAFSIQFSFAGNPDRQGQAGAAQLLMNPWARSAGLHSMSTANVTGAEAMRINVAGISRINKSEFVFAHTRYLEGTDVSLNAFGMVQKVGKSGAMGVSLMAVDLGDILVTTTDQPEGTGATFSPALFNLGLSYSHMFENKISVGVLFRAISESTSDLNAFGFGIDAGVQYVTGPQDNFKFGISLRNIGSPMKFSGEGLSEQLGNPDEALAYDLTYFQRSEKFELPSALNIGLSYDFIIGEKNRVTILGNFTSNSFSQDAIGGGIEFSLNEMFMLRGGYKLDFGQVAESGDRAPVYTGPSAGLSVMLPVRKDSDTRVGLDYGYRLSNPWSGSHNISIRFAL